MSDETTESGAPDIPVVEEATEVVESQTEPRPEWVDEIIEAVTSVPEQIENTTPDPVEPEAVPGVESPEPDEDETPSGVPWTHRNPFKRS